MLTYFLYNIIFVLDGWDFLLRLYWRLKHIGPRQWIEGRPRAYPTSIHLRLSTMTAVEKKKRLKPFAIVVSVFNAESYIRGFLDGLKPHWDRILIVDDCSTDKTYRILEECGIRYIRNESNMKKPASIKKAVNALPEDVETVIVMDPDSEIVDSGMKKDITDLEEVLSDFQRSGADGCAVRIKAREENSVLIKLQEMEYNVCLSLGRKSLLDKTVVSGIAIYRKGSLKKAMDAHPLSVYAEDFMTSLLILNNGGRIYYDGRLLVVTEGKNRLRWLVSQRIGWDFGYILAYFHALKRIIKGMDEAPLLKRDKRPILMYNYAVYLPVLGILLHPIKLMSVFILMLSFINLAALLAGLDLPFKSHIFVPFWFLFFYIQYCLLSLGLLASSSQKEQRKRYLGLVPLYPFYTLFLLMIRTVGFFNYITVISLGRKVYHDHY